MHAQRLTDVRTLQKKKKKKKQSPQLRAARVGSIFKIRVVADGAPAAANVCSRAARGRRRHDAAAASPRERHVNSECRTCLHCSEPRSCTRINTIHPRAPFTIPRTGPDIEFTALAVDGQSIVTRARRTSNEQTRTVGMRG